MHDFGRSSYYTDQHNCYHYLSRQDLSQDPDDFQGILYLVCPEHISEIRVHLVVGNLGNEDFYQS